MSNMVQCNYKGCTETEKKGVWLDEDAGWSIESYRNGDSVESFVLCSTHTRQFDIEYFDENVHLSLEQFKQWLNGEEPKPIADA
jgi:hypothetical protein